MIRFIKFLIQILVNYLNTSKSKWKYDIAQYSVVLAIFPINYLIFHYIFHSNSIIGIFVFSIGSGRLLNAWIMERHDCDFGEGYITPLRYISYSSVMVVTFGIMFLLIKNGYENHSVSDRIKETNKPAYKVSEKNETNTTIKSMYQPSFPTVQLHQPLKE